MKDVQCYELFGGIALKNHAFSFFLTLDLKEVFLRIRDALLNVSVISLYLSISAN